MFAGDRNSASSLQDPKLRYLDLARLNHDIPSSSEYNVDNVIRLENFKLRGSPIATRKNGATVYADVDVINDGKRTEDVDVSNATKTQKDDLESSHGGTSLTLDDFLDSEPPNWAPPPPPGSKNEPLVYSQGDDNRRTSPDKLSGGFGESTENGPLADGATLKKNMQGNAQDNFEKGSAGSAKNEPLAEGSGYSGDTSEDDDAMDWPPPPPPPQRLSYQHDDSDWERPLPPEILALPGKRDRVASWARDEAEGSNDFDDFTKI